MKPVFKKTVVLNEPEHQTRLKIGDVAKRSGIGIETLRFYEKSGLIERPARTTSGYRLYTTDVLDRLVFIKQAQALGFSLDQIGRIIGEARSGQSPCAEVREIVRQQLVEVDQRIQALQTYRAAIAETLDAWELTGQAPGQVCGLIEGTTLDAEKHKSSQFRSKKPCPGSIAVEKKEGR